MEMHLSGVNMHYELTGSGARRVVLLHGWGCSTDLMKPVADALASDMTVLSVDFPAHGKSSQPPEPWGVPEFAACLEELLVKLDFLLNGDPVGEGSGTSKKRAEQAAAAAAIGKLFG